MDRKFLISMTIMLSEELILEQIEKNKEELKKELDSPERNNNKIISLTSLLATFYTVLSIKAKFPTTTEAIEFVDKEDSKMKIIENIDKTN